MQGRYPRPGFPESCSIVTMIGGVAARRYDAGHRAFEQGMGATAPTVGRRYCAVGSVVSWRELLSWVMDLPLPGGWRGHAIAPMRCVIGASGREGGGVSARRVPPRAACARATTCS